MPETKPARRFVVDLVTTVELTVHDPEVLDRVQTDEWRHQMHDWTERQAVMGLCRMMGMQGALLSDLDGWADLPATAATAKIVGSGGARIVSEETIKGANDA